MLRTTLGHLFSGVEKVESMGGFRFKKRFTKSKEIFEECIMLPINTFISDEDVLYVCKKIKEFTEAMKRLFDIIFSFFGLILLSPIFFITAFLIWKQDFHSPLYIANRVGKNKKIFKMIKFRSMIINADKSGVDSTGSNDTRITKVGKYVRKFKLDELTQLINVLKGDISLVGPRPNVKSETDLYTDQELKLLTVKPGITDISSIVFSDEGEILKWHKDPDLAYNQLIVLGKVDCLFYIQKRDIKMDILLILVTVLSIFSRKKSLKLLNQILKLYNAPIEIINISKRNTKLVPTPPPGSDQIVLKR